MVVVIGSMVLVRVCCLLVEFRCMVVCWRGMLETGFDLAYGMRGEFDGHEFRYAW